MILKETQQRQGKSLAKASLPSNHLAEAGAGALWGPDASAIGPGGEQMKMLILGAAGILEGRGPSSYLRIVSYSLHFGFVTCLREEKGFHAEVGLEDAVVGC